MIKIKKNTKGFTLIEITLVIVIIVISLGFSVLYSQTSQLRADINTQVSQFVSYARLAHSSASAGLDNKSHGIHLETSSYTVFEGDSYNPADPQNYEIALPGTISIQNINLNGGGNDMIFSSPRGETSTYGTLQFSSNKIDKTVTITISKVGTINY